MFQNQDILKIVPCVGLDILHIRIQLKYGYFMNVSNSEYWNFFQSDTRFTHCQCIIINYMTKTLSFLGDLHNSGTKNWESFLEKMGKKTPKTQKSNKSSQLSTNNVRFSTGHNFQKILILKHDFKYCLCPIEGFSLIFYLS